MEITLQDVNDNPPVFPTDMLDLTVEENVGDGSKIMQLTAMDADEVGDFLFESALQRCYNNIVVLKFLLSLRKSGILLRKVLFYLLEWYSYEILQKNQNQL